MNGFAGSWKQEQGRVDHRISHDHREYTRKIRSDDHDDKPRIWVYQYVGVSEELGPRIGYHFGTIPVPIVWNRQEPVRVKFERLVATWQEESQFMSSTLQMSILPSYQAIIGMGPPAIPLILEQLQREPDHWFWALQAITQEDPVPPESKGNLKLMTEAWLSWGRMQHV